MSDEHLDERSNPPECLDSKWFDEFERVGSFQAHALLDIPEEERNRQKKLFLAGEITNPRFEYPKLDATDLREKERLLVDLKKKIRAEEKNKTVAQLYDWKINEKIAELRMLKSTLANDMSQFVRWSKLAYGKPNQEIFHYTLGKLEKGIAAAGDSCDPELQKAATDLQKVLPKNPAEKASTIDNPQIKTFEALRETVREQFADLLDLVDPEMKKYPSEDLRAIFERALREACAEQSWHIAVDANKVVINVDVAQNEIGIPPGKNYLNAKVKDLIVHEIGVHVKRYLAGKKTKLKLLSLGLDRYDRGEEGLATLAGSLAKAPKEFQEYEMLDRQLAISLATGADDQPRNFRQTFEILQKYYFFKEMQACAKLKDLEKQSERRTKAMGKSQNEAWLRGIRTFRGSDFATPGAVFTKDIAYAEGNIGTWYLLDDNQTMFGRIGFGKFDQTNPRHIKALMDLQIGDFSDADLARAERNPFLGR